MIIPVITGSTGVETGVLQINLLAVAGKHSNGFTTADSCTGNGTLNTDRTAG
jgi:hypothetical protein